MTMQLEIKVITALLCLASRIVSKHMTYPTTEATLKIHCELGITMVIIIVTRELAPSQKS